MTKYLRLLSCLKLVKVEIPKQGIHFTNEQLEEPLIHVVISAHPEAIKIDQKILFGIDLYNIEDAQFLNVLQIHVNREVDICGVELLLFLEMAFQAAFFFELLHVGLLVFHLSVGSFCFLSQRVYSFYYRDSVVNGQWDA